MSFSLDQDADGPDHTPGRQELASSAAHALNNLLAVLFAASSYLEDENPSARALERARSAVAGACASGEALGAGLALLAVGGNGLAQLASAQGNAMQFGSADLDEIEQVLRETGGINNLDRSTAGLPLSSWLDRDTLKSLLVSIGVTMRRRFGKTCDITLVVSPSAGSQAGCMFEFRPASTQGESVPVLRTSDHPCTIALEAIRAPLAALGSGLDFEDSGVIRFRMMPTGG